ncbi:MAG: DUF6273 domain-containing protein [Coriobacteriales bacterium]|jgi:tetratricopeptide (TPR) repeat protein|nr:DUF6273 domain-containing protein [Coriobacteriales bacterium]
MIDPYDELRLSQSSKLTDIQRIIAKLRQDWEQPAKEIAMPDETARHLKLLDEADSAFTSEESRAEYNAELARSKSPQEEADPSAERRAKYEKWLGDAKRYYQRKQYDLARPAIEKALQYREAESEDPEAFCLASDIYRELRQFDEAFRAINEAILLEPGNVEFYLGKATLQYFHMALSFKDDLNLDARERTKRYEESSNAAIATLSIALEEAKVQSDQSLVADCHVFYAWQYLKMDEEDKARSHTDYALAADATNQEAEELRRHFQEVDGERRRRNERRWSLMITKDKERDIGLFISRDIVAKMPYHIRKEAITWEHCTLRKWLNNEFYDSLPDYIKSRVVEVVNQNPYNTYDPENIIRGGNPTRDKVFLLSVDEAQRHLLNDAVRIVKYNGTDAGWRLRSPGVYANYAAYVHGAGIGCLVGTVCDFGGGVNGEDGVRPALWLRL